MHTADLLLLGIGHVWVLATQLSWQVGTREEPNHNRDDEMHLALPCSGSGNYAPGPCCPRALWQW